MLEGLVQGIGELVDLLVAVVGRGVDPETLGTERHGWVIDRLQVDVVKMQETHGGRLAQLRVAHEHWQHMSLRTGHDWNVPFLQALAQLRCEFVEPLALR
ncbi:hypothetical protein D9M69_558220 [compost metagenome]